MDAVIRAMLVRHRAEIDEALASLDHADEQVDAGREIIFGKNVDEGFKSSVLWIEAQLKLNADFLMACMAFETGGTFSPSVKNAAGSSGLGLIQFMQATYDSMVKRHPNLRDVSASHDALAHLTAQQQLTFVYYYFLDFGKDLSAWKLEDVYMAILYPAAIGKPLDWKMPWAAGSLAYKQNSGLDANKDQTVTKAEAAAGVQKKYVLGQQLKG
jgi:hypothetical protein